MCSKVLLDRHGARQRFLDDAEQGQDHQEVAEPIRRRDERDGSPGLLRRHRPQPHQQEEIDDQQREPPFEHRPVATRADRRGVEPGRQRHDDNRTEHRDHAEELGVDDAAGDPVGRDDDPDVAGEGPQDRVERQEVPFRHDVRGRRQRVRLDIVVGVAEVIRHEAHDGKEHQQDHDKREQVLDDEVGPERQRVLLGLGLRRAADFDARGVVVAGRVERPDMHHGQAQDQEGHQVVQREEAVQRRIVDGRSAQQPGLQPLADPRDRAEEAGDDGGTPERHLTPGQHVAHEGGAHHQQIDDDADDPRDLARGLVGAVVQIAEDVRIDRHEEQRCTVRVDVAQRPAAVHVAHDVLDARESVGDMGRIVHDQHDAGDDLQDQCERQDDAPDPHPVQVAGGRDHQRVVEQTQDRNTPVDPFLGRGLRFIVVVRNASHLGASSAQPDR